ncbi:MAG TPA: GNAT family N-acetyltransferase [Spirochaetota bacterium]|nr:GNAT family N-acetyltransferase [Spirochaetota bacterium]
MLFLRETPKCCQKQAYEILQQYLAEISSFGPVQVDEKQNFYSSAFAFCFKDEKYKFYLFQLKTVTIGFAVIKLKVHKNYNEIADFYIAQKYRRQNWGQKAFRAILELFPGQWFLNVNCKNTGALHFWKKSLALPFIKKQHSNRSALRDYVTFVFSV